MDNQRREKLDLVWGSVFLFTFAMWGVTLLILEGGTGTAPIMIALGIGVILSLVIVPLLLSVPGSSATLLKAGRILLWLEVSCLGVGALVGLMTLMTQ